MAFEAKRLYYLLTSANGFRGETTDSTDSSELTNLTLKRHKVITNEIYTIERRN